MKHYLNQRGSLPIVLIIVLVMTMSVVALTSLHISEQINLSASATKDVDNLYAEDSVREMTIHAFRQILTHKKITVIGSDPLITMDDVVQLEHLVNKEMLPHYGFVDYQVFVGIDYLPPTVDYFCVLETDITGEAPDGYDCLAESFDVRLHVQILHRQHVQNVLLEVSGLHLETTEDGQAIRMNTTQATYSLKKK